MSSYLTIPTILFNKIGGTSQISNLKFPSYLQIANETQDFVHNKMYIHMLPKFLKTIYLSNWKFHPPNFILLYLYTCIIYMKN